MTHLPPPSHLLQRRRMVASLAALPGLAGTGWGLVAGPAAAQAAYPSRQIHLLIPAGVGTVSDMVGRLLATAWIKSMGQPIVVENNAAAGGMPGTQQLVRSPKDGYTIAILNNNHVVNPSIYKDMPFDSIKDIGPISLIGSTPMILVAKNSLPVKNVADVLALARAKPGELTYGSAGNGTILHLAGVNFTSEGKVSIRHIPYKGVGPAITDVISGQIDLAFLGVASAAAHVEAGKMRAIAITTPYRSGMLPSVPTMAEQGLTNYSLDGWIALSGPAGLPRPIVDKLNAELRTALASKEMQEAMAKIDVRLAPSTPEVAAQFFQTELDKHAALAKRGMATLD